jgi:hypothetical protein
VSCRVSVFEKTVGKKSGRINGTANPLRNGSSTSLVIAGGNPLEYEKDE